MSKKTRLDNALVARKLAVTRSQAENFVKLGQVTVDDRVISKPGYFVGDEADIKITTSSRYVSRAALKLASVADTFKIDFRGKIILDVGSSTGGFTDFALQKGAKKVIAVENGTDQLHPSLRGNTKIELHERTDIRNVKQLTDYPDIVVIDVSFVSLRDILPHIASLVNAKTQIVAMFKPQFESGPNLKHKGVIKNERIRREITKDFESWLFKSFVIDNKADSKIHGSKGNIERFYLLHLA